MTPRAAALFFLMIGPVPVTRHGRPSDRAQGPRSAQQIVDRMVATHADVKAIELAVGSLDDCETIAATAPEDLGEQCDDDELGPMRTGEPDVEAPTKEDPVYDITQALHDSAGNLIGAVGMDLARARSAHPVQAEASGTGLLGPAPGTGGGPTRAAVARPVTGG